jgi:hypothetical protein
MAPTQKRTHDAARDARETPARHSLVFPLSALTPVLG